MGEQQKLKEEIGLQILELLKEIKRYVERISKIYDMIYGEELEETEEKDPNIPGVTPRPSDSE